MEHGAVGAVRRWSVSPGISVARFSAEPMNNAILRASSARDSCAGSRQLQDHLRCTLGHLELISIRALDGGFGALMHRVKRLEMDHLIGFQGLIIFQAAQHGQAWGRKIISRHEVVCRPLASLARTSTVAWMSSP